jgi:hypothetical protein
VLTIPSLKAQRTLYIAVERGRNRRSSVEALFNFLNSKEVKTRLKALKPKELTPQRG